MKSEIFFRGGLDSPNQLEIAQEIRFQARGICRLLLASVLGWRRECQSIPTETKRHFQPFLDQNPPFELRPPTTACFPNDQSSATTPSSDKREDQPPKANFGRTRATQ